MRATDTGCLFSAATGEAEGGSNSFVVRGEAPVTKNVIRAQPSRNTIQGRGTERTVHVSCKPSIFEHLQQQNLVHVVPYRQTGRLRRCVWRWTVQVRSERAKHGPWPLPTPKKIRVWCKRLQLYLRISRCRSCPQSLRERGASRGPSSRAHTTEVGGAVSPPPSSTNNAKLRDPIYFVHVVFIHQIELLRANQVRCFCVALSGA